MFIPPGEDQKNGLVDPFLLTTNPWSPWAPGIPEPVLAGTSTTATVANIAKPPVMDMAMSKTYKSPPKKTSVVSPTAAANKLHNLFRPKFAGTWPKSYTDTLPESHRNLLEASLNLAHQDLPEPSPEPSPEPRWSWPGSPPKPSGTFSGTSLNLARLSTKAFRNLLRNLAEPGPALHHRLGTMQSADILCVHRKREREENHPFQKETCTFTFKSRYYLTSVCRESFLFETELFFICMFEGLLRLVLLGCVWQRNTTSFDTHDSVILKNIPSAENSVLWVAVDCLSSPALHQSLPVPSPEPSWTWICTKVSQTFFGTFSKTLLIPTWLCTKASPRTFSGALLNLMWLCTKVSQTFSGTFCGTFSGTLLNLTWLCTPPRPSPNLRNPPEPSPKPCWTWPGSAPNSPRPFPEPSLEPCWTWPGACQSLPDLLRNLLRNPVEPDPAPAPVHTGAILGWRPD